MSRYLHIDAELQYYKARSRQFLNYTDHTSMDVTSPYESYPVKFERRMRSREVHYIDHPLVGMIVLATPFKIEPETTPGKPANNYQTL
jgi:hypothetical protein